MPQLFTTILVFCLPKMRIEEMKRRQSTTRQSRQFPMLPANAYFKLSAFKALYGSKEDKDEIFEWLKKIVGLNPSLKESVKLFAEIDWI
jgi:hypothetical protein